MVAPLSQASNNSTGMSGYTSACGSGANTSAYVGTQQLAMLPGCSSSGFGKIERSTGNAVFGGQVTYTLGADVDIHSEIYYNWSVPKCGADAGSAVDNKWIDGVGLNMLHSVVIKVGTSVWETIYRPSMAAMARLEMSQPEYVMWRTSTAGVGLAESTLSGTSKLMCCIKGGSRGQLFVAAMPYQTVTIQVNFNSVANCFKVHDGGAYSNNELGFDIYTKQHILSPYERGLMQSTDILQLLGTTEHYRFELNGGSSIPAGYRIPTIDLSFLNDYCTHILVWIDNGPAGKVSYHDQPTVPDSMAAGGWCTTALKELEFVYNGTSAQGKLPGTLCSAEMLGLDIGGIQYSGGNVELFQLANTPCVTSLSSSQSQLAPFAGGDGVSNNRYDVIQFNGTIAASDFLGGAGTDIPAGSYINFVAFGAQSILYSQGGAVKN